jgi:hypothetical protein
MKRRGFFNTLLAVAAALVMPIPAPAVKPALKAGVYGWEEIGYAIIDSRAVFTLPKETKLPTSYIEGDEIFVPFKSSRGRFLRSCTFA